MCIEKHYIRNKYGRLILVPCGKCEACKQSKAVQRTNRIRNEHSKDKCAVFVTLTYRNECIPYVKEEDLTSEMMPVYRDCTVRWVNDYKNEFGHMVQKRKETRGTTLLTTIDNTRNSEFLTFCDYLTLKPLVGYAGRYGVCFYKDVQDYIKRLRINLERNYGYFPISYYSCSELGPSSQRPHFHLLVFIPQGRYKQFKYTAAKSWSYDDYHRCYANISVARNASSYVSSYVNSDASVSRFFKAIKEFRPKHSYSKNFGVAADVLSFDKVMQKVHERDLRYDCSRIRDNALVVDNILLPKYVIGRYFPKIKGYSRLTRDEIFNIALEPRRLATFAGRLDYTNEDLHKNRVMLQNKLNYAMRHGFDIFDYAKAYSEVWLIRSSQVLKEMYESVNFIKDYFTLYDNIGSFYAGEVQNDSLDELMFHLPKDFDYPYDFNRFPQNVAKHNNLVSAYHSYSKDRKVRNIVYSKTMNI